MIFFLTLTVRRLSHRKDFKLKKYGGPGLISGRKKTEPLFAKLHEEAEAASSSYSATGIFLQCNYSMLLAKNN